MPARGDVCDTTSPDRPEMDYAHSAVSLGTEPETGTAFIERATFSAVAARYPNILLALKLTGRRRFKNR